MLSKASMITAMPRSQAFQEAAGDSASQKPLANNQAPTATLIQASHSAPKAPTSRSSARNAISAPATIGLMRESPAT